MILAEDEASLYLQATTTRIWAPRGRPPVVRLDPNRSKVNFYGTLDLRSGQQIVQQADTLNSENTARYLQTLLEHYPDQPILLLWDRAKWHQGTAVKEFLQAHPRLQVMFFPPASPELNPQEQVWKVARQAVSHNHSVLKLASLAQAFEAFLSSTSFSSNFLKPFALHRICPEFI